MERKLLCLKEMWEFIDIVYIRPTTSFSLSLVSKFVLLLSLCQNLGITVSLMHSRNLRFVSVSIADAVLNWWCCWMPLWFKYLHGIVNWKTYPFFSAFDVNDHVCLCEFYILDIFDGNSILFAMTFSYLFLSILDWCLLPTFTHLIRNLN